MNDGPDHAVFRPASELPASLRAAARAFEDRELARTIIELATLPPLDFDEAEATPIAAADDPQAIRDLEWAWEAAWGAPLAAAAV